MSSQLPGTDLLGGLIRAAVAEAMGEVIYPLLADTRNEVAELRVAVLQISQASLSECDELLTTRETAELFKMSPKSIYRMSKRGELSPAFVVNGAPRYRRSELLSFFKTNSQTPKER